MPSARKTPDNAELTARLGYEFKTPQLLQDALTHPSLAGYKQRKKGAMPYERLEFLGDRVLGLIVAEWLYEKYPDASEGELAKRHAALVNREALRVVAVEIGLGQHLRLARGEDASAARKNLATLPDAMEAIIGALYLDGGLKAASGFIHRYWQKDIGIAEAPADPKTVLQEWAQGQKLPLPQYKVVEHSGPAHAPKFIVEVTVKGHAPATAEGNSKREAQKAAALLLLQQVKKK
ncbi:MAG TPA: ribonuclease III [Alphaproteobacteria bacterium]|nr:ribonuclease III [Alphaproteobacteria bacterium]